MKRFSSQFLAIGLLVVGMSGTAFAQTPPPAHQQHGQMPAQHQQHQGQGHQPGQHQENCQCCCCRMMMEMMRRHGMHQPNAAPAQPDAHQQHQGANPN